LLLKERASKVRVKKMTLQVGDCRCCYEAKDGPEEEEEEEDWLRENCGQSVLTCRLFESTGEIAWCDEDTTCCVDLAFFRVKDEKHSKVEGPDRSEQCLRRCCLAIRGSHVKSRMLKVPIEKSVQKPKGSNRSPFDVRGLFANRKRCF
jgi:hypothetical protein